MASKRSVGTLTESDLKGKKVFLRADLNVPLDDSQKMLYQAMEAHTADIKLTVGVDPTETYTGVYEGYTFKKDSKLA